MALRNLISKRGGRQRGAALVEFAIIAQLLLVLLFGIVEAGWAFNQQLEVRHGSREGARLVAVDYGTDAQVAAEVCTRMHFSGDLSSTTVRIGTTGDGAFPGGMDIGDVAKVTVQANYAGLTGFLDGIFGSATINSSVEIRLEQPPNGGLGGNSAVSC